MKFLLDTHALLWFFREPDKIPRFTFEQMLKAGPQTGVSIASLWEIAIKVSAGKLELPKPYAELFPESLTQAGFTLLGIDPEHLFQLTTLPFHHRDPFDRLLIAQAKAERLTIITCDPHFASYAIETLWK